MGEKFDALSPIAQEAVREKARELLQAKGGEQPVANLSTDLAGLQENIAGNSKSVQELTKAYEDRGQFQTPRSTWR